MLEHANPVHFPLLLASSIGLVLGLWLHDWIAIAGASLLAVSGHIYCWARPEDSIPDDRESPNDKASILKPD